MGHFEAGANVPEPDATRGTGRLPSIIGQSMAMRRLVATVAQVAPKDVTVLVRGETGTGKELIASLVHARSSRSQGPFVRFNCAAIPGELAEAQLFGHVQGAFTGATHALRGFFAQADGGTLVLDEVGELPLAIQAKLLRALQGGEIQPVGAARVERADVRVVACTNRDLAAEVRAGRFREDLYYRLAVLEFDRASASRAPRRHSGAGCRVRPPICQALRRRAGPALTGAGRGALPGTVAWQRQAARKCGRADGRALQRRRHQRRGVCQRSKLRRSGRALHRPGTRRHSFRAAGGARAEDHLARDGGGRREPVGGRAEARAEPRLADHPAQEIRTCDAYRSPRHWSERLGRVYRIDVIYGEPAGGGLNISQTLVRHRGSFVSGGLEISPPKAMWAQN